MNNKLIPALSETLFGNALDLSMEYGELALDTLIENETLKDIPVIGTLVNLSHAVISIRDRHLLKKILVFTQRLNQGLLSGEEIRRHRAELEKDDRRMQKELEYILIILEKYTELEKCKFLANIYKAYIIKSINWEQFTAYVDILDRLLLYDLTELENIYNKYAYRENEWCDCAKMARLSGLGLVQYFDGFPKTISTNPISGNKKIYRARITGEGKAFYSVLTKGKVF